MDRKQLEAKIRKLERQHAQALADEYDCPTEITAYVLRSIYMQLQNLRAELKAAPQEQKAEQS